MGRREAWSADRSSDSRTKPTRWEFRGRRHANKAALAEAAGHDNRGHTIEDDEDGGGGGDSGRMVGVSDKKTMTDGSGKTKEQTVKIRLVDPPCSRRLVVVRRYQENDGGGGDGGKSVDKMADGKMVDLNVVFV